MKESDDVLLYVQRVSYLLIAYEGTDLQVKLLTFSNEQDPNPPRRGKNIPEIKLQLKWF